MNTRPSPRRSHSLEQRHLPALLPGHHIELLEGGRDYFAALVTAIDTAVQEVRLETYIFNRDAAAELVLQALVRAAARGVQVYLMVDAVGTPQLPPEWREALVKAGGHCLVYRPVRRWGLLLPGQWRRLHRKLALIDGQVAFCGGINLLDDWLEPGMPALSAPRFDFAVQVRGPLVAQVQATMAQLWWRTQAVQSARDVQWRAGWDAWLEATAVQRARSAAFKQAATAGAIQSGPLVRAALLLRDNVHHRSEIERAYRKAIALARQDIIIANAYFLPGRRLRQALIRAAQRGVRVRLLLLAHFTWPLQAHAVRWMYRPLIEADVEIHEYAASFLHAKVAVVDGQWATVGSSNLDPLSLLLAREANVVVQDPVFGERLRQRLLHALANEGRQVSREGLAVPWWSRMLDSLAVGLMRLMVLLAGRRY